MNIADSLDVIIHVERRSGTRYVSEVTEIRKYDPDDDRYDLGTIHERPDPGVGVPKHI